MLNWSYMYASYLNVYILSYCKLFFMLFIFDYIIFLITLNMLLKTLKLEYFLQIKEHILRESILATLVLSSLKIERL